MFKKVLPVAVAIVLILLITVVVSGVKAANDKLPTLDDAEKVYASFDGYDLTYDRLYNHMKQTYGVSEMVYMIDEVLFSEELSKFDAENTADSDEYKAFLLKNVFKNEEIAEANAAEKKEALHTWDNIVTSLQINRLITSSEAAASRITSFDLDAILSSAAWKAVKSEYKMTWIRQQYGYKAYLDKYIKDNETTEENPFQETLKEDEENSIEAYYNANYPEKVDGFFIPFSSEKAVYAALENAGVNTNQSLMSDTSIKGWVKNSFNVFEKSLSDITEDDYLSYTDIFKIFVKLYNDVYGYANGGEDIITESDYSEKVLNKQTAIIVGNKFKSLFTDVKFGATIKIPEKFEVALNGTTDKATVTWSIANTTYATYAEGVLTGVAEEFTNDSLSITLNFSVEFEGYTYTSSVAATLKQNAENPVEEIKLEDFGEIDAFNGIELNESLFNKDVKGAKFSWTPDEAKAINETLAKYLCVTDSSLSVKDDPSNHMVESYTAKPVLVGDYYFLIIKLADHAQEDLYVKDENGTYVKDEENNYTVNEALANLIPEIIEAKKEALKTDENANQMIFLLRNEHGLKIYDRFLEAVYKYQHDNFFAETLKLTDYDEFKTTKKNQKKVVFSIQKEAGNKKSAVEVTAEELFAKLEAKYATISMAALFEGYYIVNSSYNKVFNIYADKKNQIINKETYKNLITSEVAALKKNFEAGYFTYSYLSYYGITPAFPAKYGWSHFIHDYFNAYSDEEILVSSIYGGTVYSDCLTALQQDLFMYDEVCELFKGYEEELKVSTIKAEMEKAREEYYNVDATNLFVYIDLDYNNNSSTVETLMEDRYNWTEEQNNAAKELLQLFYDLAPQTNKGTTAEQLTELVKLYKEAPYGGSTSDINQAREDNLTVYEFNYFGYFKTLGLQVKSESATTYSSSSSLVEEFVEMCQNMYKENSSLVGKTLAQPIYSEPTLTDYGWHKIAVSKFGEMTDLPSEQEIAVSRAQAKVNQYEASITEIDNNIASYKKDGYSTEAYECQKAVALENLENAKAHLKEILAKFGLAEDYALDDDASARISAWYEQAEATLTDSLVTTKAYAAIFKANSSKLAFNGAIKAADFNEFVNILAEQSLNILPEDR